MKNAYNHPSLKPPIIPKSIMAQLLRVCTTETPFRHVTGKFFLQVDGVSMGSPLGPLFANFYMGEIETKILNELDEEEKPLLYCRYVDDVFVMVKSYASLINLKSKFESESVLSFTFEFEKQRHIPFLDVNVRRRNSSLETSVFVKQTNAGDCINFQGLAPEKYKVGVMKTMLHRAYKISSSWPIFHSEVRRLRQLFTNNNFPASLVDKEIQQFLSRKFEPNINMDQPNNEVFFYYRNQMSSQYKQEERNIRKIVNNHISSPSSNIRLHVYYKNKKLSQLMIRNNIHPNTTNSHVVYKYTCNHEECQPLQYYIGYTTTALKQRLTCHTQQGSIREHHLSHHGNRIRTADLMEHIEILHRSQEKQELIIAEAILIKQNSPKMNNQREGETRVLKIF